ncbi:hypothetical protein QJS66_01540 [Kocuria rhizophila]|nr:hypothetical protein QJS66_01540 [Kocuria rhizophila]
MDIAGQVQPEDLLKFGLIPRVHRPPARGDDAVQALGGGDGADPHRTCATRAGWKQIPQALPAGRRGAHLRPPRRWRPSRSSRSSAAPVPADDGRSSRTSSCPPGRPPGPGRHRRRLVTEDAVAKIRGP